MNVVGRVQRMLRGSAAPAARQMSVVVAKQVGTMGPGLVRTGGVRGARSGTCSAAVGWGRGGNAASFHAGAVARWKIGDPTDPEGGHLCGSKEGDKTDVHEEHPEIHHQTDTHLESPMVKHDLAGAPEPTEGFIREFYKGKTVPPLPTSRVTSEPLRAPFSLPALFRAAEPYFAPPITRPVAFFGAPSHARSPSFDKGPADAMRLLTRYACHRSPNLQHVAPPEASLRILDRRF